MESVELVGRLFAHMEWADRRLVRLLNEAPAARTSEAMRLLSHLLAAERVWLLRLRGQDARLQAVWPELALEEVNAMAAANRAGYARYLARLGPEELERVVEYLTQAGAPFRTRAADILSHVALHGAYHRGQIAASLRASGAEPVSTDFILFAREREPVG